MTASDARTGARRPLLVATGLATAAALVVTGCGSSGSSGDTSSGSLDGQVLSAAYTATTGAKTARVQIRTSVQAQGSGASVNSSGTSDGTLDLATGDQDLVTQLPTGGSTETLRVGGVVYTKLPVVGGAPAPAKPWVKVTLTGAAASSGTDDPTQALTYLRGAARSISKVGSERVRDADTTHYKADIDLAKLAAEAGQSPAPGQPDPGTQLRQLLGRDTLPVDIWVDAQKRIRRLQTVSPILSGSASGGSTGAAPSATPTSTGTATVIEEFYDFGTPVTIAPPPPDQVSDTPVRVVPPPAPSGAPAPPTPGTAVPSTQAPVTS